LQERFDKLIIVKTINEIASSIGITSFRSPQDEIIKSIIGKKITLALLPTGYGKSICYQIPAIYFPKYTLVISPLIALMDDQVFNLRKKDISAIALHSSQEVDSKTFLDLFHKNHYKLIYISPEKLLNNNYQKLFKDNPPSLIAIDEAHCFSLWGHDFRPEYRRLPKYIFEINPSPAIALFTATASKKVIVDLVGSFNIRKENIFAGDFFRQNLFISIKKFFLKSQKFLYLCYLVFHKYKNKNGLIYCITRKEVEILYKALKKYDFFKKLKLEFFHAGRDKKEKQIILEKFIKNEIKLLITTNAFGMGVDKSNINFVVHFQIPSCLENYVQEIGRAGRDRKLSFCELLAHSNDFEVHKNFNSKKSAIKKMSDYIEKNSCHHKKILSFFGQPMKYSFNCQSCNYCSPSSEIFFKKFNSIQKSNTFINQQKIIFKYKKYPRFLNQYNSVGSGYLLDVLE
jgi:ATP-dependent DNA helicase RecQ